MQKLEITLFAIIILLGGYFAINPMAGLPTGAAIDTAPTSVQLEENPFEITDKTISEEPEEDIYVSVDPEPEVSEPEPVIVAGQIPEEEVQGFTIPDDIFVINDIRKTSDSIYGVMKSIKNGKRLEFDFSPDTRVDLDDLIKPLEWELRGQHKKKYVVTEFEVVRR